MTNVIIISVTQCVLVNTNFSDAFKFKMKVTIMEAIAKIHTIKQNGKNLGYCSITVGPSREIAMAVPDKTSKHSSPRLKKIA